MVEIPTRCKTKQGLGKPLVWQDAEKGDPQQLTSDAKTPSKTA
jgi:hypothetical protein